MKLQVTSVTLMAPDPLALADFYSRLLSRPVTTAEENWAQIRDESGSQPTLNFEYEKSWQQPAWPAEPGRQTATQHLDIRVDDLETTVTHALAAGATLAPFQPQETVRVLLDPAGHPFCLFA